LHWERLYDYDESLIHGYNTEIDIDFQYFYIFKAPKGVEAYEEIMAENGYWVDLIESKLNGLQANTSYTDTLNNQTVKVIDVVLGETSFIVPIPGDENGFMNTGKIKVEIINN
jgi:hypothetical protein